VISAKVACPNCTSKTYLKKSIEQAGASIYTGL